jgi:hypothetical protein
MFGIHTRKSLQSRFCNCESGTLSTFFEKHELWQSAKAVQMQRIVLESDCTIFDEFWGFWLIWQRHDANVWRDLLMIQSFRVEKSREKWKVSRDSGRFAAVISVGRNAQGEAKEKPERFKRPRKAEKPFHSFFSTFHPSLALTVNLSFTTFHRFPTSASPIKAVEINKLSCFAFVQQFFQPRRQNSIYYYEFHLKLLQLFCIRCASQNVLLASSKLFAESTKSSFIHIVL